MSLAAAAPQFRKHAGKKHIGLKKPLPEALAQAVAESMYGVPLHKCQTAQVPPRRPRDGGGRTSRAADPRPPDPHPP